jgi:phosphonoacetate hydrolase
MADLALPRASVREIDQALATLLSAALEPIVDLVAWSPEPDVYEVASQAGHVRFRREPGVNGLRRPAYAADLLSGASPVHNQDPAHLGELALQHATPHPSRSENAYPHAFDHLAQVFDHPSAPDLVVVHTGAHYWGDQGGHLGEHGSLGVLQSRAPFIASGAGITNRGLVDESCRLIDVAPTVLAVLGHVDDQGRAAAAIDGQAVTSVVARPGAAQHVVAFLLDGTNPTVLYDLAARGEAPNIARLMAAGTTFRFGATASMPTVTLANHTAILTGTHPGHHGVLHNAWVDRATGAQVITNSPSTWVNSMQWLNPRVETLHHALHRLRPGSTTISINEPCDAGADYSVFDLMRRGESVDRAPPADQLPDATERFVRPSKDYRWSSLIDHTAYDQFAGIWSGQYRGRAWDKPTFSWVNFTLTDSAFHEGGPYSEIAAASVRDTDARIGRILGAVEAAGALDSTAFFLVADHGMQLADTAVTGDWDVELAAAGVRVRDEGYGFLYLTGT